MKVGVDYGDGVKREVELIHTVIIKDKKPKEIYRSQIHTDPVNKKRCYVEFDPETGDITVKEVK